MRKKYGKVEHIISTIVFTVFVVILLSFFGRANASLFVLFGVGAFGWMLYWLRKTMKEGTTFKDEEYLDYQIGVLFGGIGIAACTAMLILFIGHVAGVMLEMYRLPNR